MAYTHNHSTPYGDGDGGTDHNDDSGLDSNAGSTRTLIGRISSTSTTEQRRATMSRRLAACASLGFLCIIGGLIGAGYIYLENNYVHEITSFPVLDFVDGRDNDLGTPMPIAEARRGRARPTFRLSTVDIARMRRRHGRDVFDPNITLRSLPENPSQKPPVSLIHELIVNFMPVFTLTNCPNFQPAFFKVNLTIGRGTGVLGFGSTKQKAKKIAAEDAVTTLFPNVTYPDQPDCQALARQCG